MSTRKCPACDEITAHDDPTCEFCRYADPGWRQALQASRRPWRSQYFGPGFEHTTHVTSFADTGQHAYELYLFREGAREAGAGAWLDGSRPITTSCPRPCLRYDYRPLAHDFDNSIVTDQYTGDVLPATVGVACLIDARRAAEVAGEWWPGAVKIEVVLPPANHPVTHFLIASGLLPPGVAQIQAPAQPRLPGRFGAIETIVPASEVSARTRGQLPEAVIDRINGVMSAGQVVRTYRRHLRRAIMELADNGCRYGKGRCVVAAYMRNEDPTGGGAANIRLPLMIDAARQIHVFAHCYTTGPTLAETLGSSDERAAVEQVLSYPAGSAGGGLGLGLGGTLRRARDEAEGTILVQSGVYTRVDMPNGIRREWTAEAGMALPGVHICLLVPLAKVAALTVSQAS